MAYVVCIEDIVAIVDGQPTINNHGIAGSAHTNNFSLEMALTEQMLVKENLMTNCTIF